MLDAVLVDETKKIHLIVFVDEVGAPTGELNANFENVNLGQAIPLSAPQGIQTEQASNLNPNQLRNFTIYPNPATHQISIDLQEYLSQEVQLTVYNKLGQPLKNSFLPELQSTIQQINISELPAGTYLLQVLSNDQQPPENLWWKSKKVNE